MIGMRDMTFAISSKVIGRSLPTFVGKFSGSDIIGSQVTKSGGYIYDLRVSGFPVILQGTPKSASHKKFPTVKCSSNGKPGPEKANRGGFASCISPALTDSVINSSISNLAPL